MTRVLLVDDHPVIRQGVQRILRTGFPDLNVVEAESGEQALDGFAQHAWDLVILDLSLPGVSGLEVLERMRRVRPDVRIIVMSIHPPRHFARRALSAGALGYVEKRAAPEEMLEAVVHVLAGRTYVSPSGSKPPDHPPGGLPHERLSDREYQVLRMVGTGQTASEIAAELGLSVKTISTYRTRILEKMDMQTTAQLMRYAIATDLVP